VRLFKWTTRNATFIPQIDDEHRDAFKLAEELRQAIEKGADRVAVQNVLRVLLAHLEEHFTHEEQLMRDINCPIYNWHKGQHDTVRKRVRLFVPQVDRADAESAGRLLEFLSTWLPDHTMLADRMTGAYVRNYARSHPAMLPS
jgi:hemerythrin